MITTVMLSALRPRLRKTLFCYLGTGRNLDLISQVLFLSYALFFDDVVFISPVISDLYVNSLNDHLNVPIAYLILQ